MSQQNNTSLYVKYRPKTLAELIGQNHAISMVTSYINSNSWSVGYLISGTTGIGKSSLALLIAKYINCDTLDACGTCGSCLDMETTDNNHPDYHYVDGAKDTGIDNIRNLIEKLKFTPFSNKIIVHMDEVHKLSQAAIESMLSEIGDKASDNVVWLFTTTNKSHFTNATNNNMKAFANRLTSIDLKKPPEIEVAKLIHKIVQKEKLTWCTDNIINKVVNTQGDSIRAAIQKIDELNALVKGSSNALDETSLFKILAETDETLANVEMNILKYYLTGNIKQLQQEVARMKYNEGSTTLINLVDASMELMNCSLNIGSRFYPVYNSLMQDNSQLKPKHFAALYNSLLQYKERMVNSNYLITGKQLLALLATTLILSR